jgi:acyl-CoA dehydrogenase
VRCHPYVLPEMHAVQNTDEKQGLIDFDRALFGHIAYTVKNGLRSLWYGLTGSHTVSVPDVAPETRRYYQQLTRFSSAFAYIADISMMVMGGDLKRKEKLSARMGDILAQMYLISATLKRYESEGRQEADAPLMHWAIWDAMYKAQEAFEGVIANYPNRFFAFWLRKVIFPFGHPYVVPSDQVGHLVARALITPGATRERLTADCFVPNNAEEPAGAVEQALIATLEAEPIDARIREAQRQGRFENNPTANVRDIATAAFEIGVITAPEYEVMRRRNRLRDMVIRVDDFPYDFGVASAAKPQEERRAA